MRITPSVTLTFDLETVALVVGNLPTNFGVSTTFRSRVMDRHASDWSRDLVTLEDTAPVRDVGHRRRPLCQV